MIIEHINCFIASGVDTDSDFTTFEAITGDLGTIPLATLPGHRIFGSSMVMHNGSMLLCGGTNNKQKCFQLCHGLWKEHSMLNKERYGHAVATTKCATFIFGGSKSRTTYEYLPKDSQTWLMGKTEIPGEGFHWGCAIAVKSDQEIWLIGGDGTDGWPWHDNRILSFNVNDHTFQELPFELIVERAGFRCALIPHTNKIMITGGVYRRHYFLDSSEILDTEDGRVTMASPMNSPRYNHGIGVITINGEDRLAVVGGLSDNDTKVDSIELYNTETEEWEITNIKLQTPSSHFGFLSLNLRDVISKL